MFCPMSSSILRVRYLSDFCNKEINSTKGQLVWKANCFVFTTMRPVFVRLLEEIEDSKKAFRNYLTFRRFILI